jgi:hypothetical protein
MNKPLQKPPSAKRVEAVIKRRRESPQERWLKRIAAAPLILTSAETAGGWRYSVGGKKCPTETAVSLIRNRLVVPVDDGLLAETPQTYVLAP